MRLADRTPIFALLGANVVSQMGDMMVAVMIASMFMLDAIPGAFGARGLMFAVAYVTIHVGRAAFAFITLRRSLGVSHPLTMTFSARCRGTRRGVLWLIGGLLDGGARYVLWGLGLAMNFGAPLTGYYTPGLGRARTAEWNIQGVHLAERCRLFIISPWASRCWWIYFDRSAETASEIISSSQDPGRLALSAYGYFHLPMIAGIIAVAASDELTVAHTGEPGSNQPRGVGDPIHPETFRLAPPIHHVSKGCSLLARGLRDSRTPGASATRARRC